MTPIKYIIVRKMGLETAIILHPSVSHNQAVNLAELDKDGGELLSAGYFMLEPDLGIVVDESLPSTSLNLRPRPEDQSIIEQTFLLNFGFVPNSQPSTLNPQLSSQ